MAGTINPSTQSPLPSALDALPERLAHRLVEPLPGWSAHAPYQPELSFGRHRGPAEFGARPAAVLVVLYPHEGQWYLPLILRPAHMLDHASQVSLPGGAIEPRETSQEAAFREFSEELGVPSTDLQLLGQLSELYLFASNFHVMPWVAALPTRPAWLPNRHEVERVLEVPLGHLSDPANSGRFERRQGPIAFTAPCFHWDGERIWGATSMVLAELVSIVNQLPR
jgi:8-oxo-dGTP pyrophosphatase MutT (NUDIX family)